MRERSRSCLFGVALILSCSLLEGSAGAAPQSFYNFESGHVRPLALAGGLLFAINTPDNRLAIYIAEGQTPTFAAEVAVGLEPVAVAARHNICYRNGDCPINVWVVNHLSDSLTVVDVVYNSLLQPPVKIRRVRTVQTCDEPRDVVLAGPLVKKAGPGRAFVTAARRGQNCPVNPRLRDEQFGNGVKRGLVQVFETETLTQLTPIQLFSDTPRALAKTPDNKRVYAAGFFTGNQTTTIPQQQVGLNGMPAPPLFAPSDPPGTGLIVKFNPTSNKWEEGWLRPPLTTPRTWPVPFALPDYDVFAIDAMALKPAARREVDGVGTVLFNMAVRPKWSLPATTPKGIGPRDQIFVSNLEALNQRRFEKNLRGHFAENRISVISGTFNARILPIGPGLFGPVSPFAGWQFGVLPVHLNSHNDYSCKPPDCTPTQSKVDASLAFPTDMVFSADGEKLYVAAFGSGAVAAFDAEQLSLGNSANRTIIRVGGGPSGLALDSIHDKLYVMDRFTNSIRTIDVSGAIPVLSPTISPLYDPSPKIVTTGRRFLYDAHTTSAHGDAACASCHIFGDLDGLAWDLGDFEGAIETNCNEVILPPGGTIKSLHPMKGPMTTQSLRGMADAGPLHWRGDRSGCTDEQNLLPDKGQYNVKAGFKKFNGAFKSLLGRNDELAAAAMQEFTDFALSMRYPPNPVRPFGGHSTEAQAGLTFFASHNVDLGLITCKFCHDLPLGTNRKSSEEGEEQQFKIAHLRNLYQKVGMFGVETDQIFGIKPTGFTGKQIRGFGYLHDGSIDTVASFLRVEAFTFPSDKERNEVEQFLLEFDTGLAPIVGQQVTLTQGAASPATLIARANAGECDLIARGVPDPALSMRERGFLYLQNMFERDDGSAKVTADQLQQQVATAGWLTYTCVPPGSGRRMGVDRDCDSTLDGTDTVNNAIPQYPAGPCP